MASKAANYEITLNEDGTATVLERCNVGELEYNNNTVRFHLPVEAVNQIIDGDGIFDTHRAVDPEYEEWYEPPEIIIDDELTIPADHEIAATDGMLREQVVRFAYNWIETARLHAKNEDYWRTRALKAEGKTEAEIEGYDG